MSGTTPNPSDEELGIERAPLAAVPVERVLSAEQASRHESVIRQRLREAHFPEVKTLDTFDFTATEGVSATQIHTLARGEWVTAPENLILAGPIGTGKTHLATALGVEATKQKRRVLFTRAADLVRQLVEARDARSCSSISSRIGMSVGRPWSPRT
jgi:DNA replication protein DnaC